MSRHPVLSQQEIDRGARQTAEWFYENGIAADLASALNAVLRREAVPPAGETGA
jgi:hypothetical protein